MYVTRFFVFVFLPSLISISFPFQDMAWTGIYYEQNGYGEIIK